MVSGWLGVREFNALVKFKVMKIRVSRDFYTKEVFDVHDFWTGSSVPGTWRGIPLPESGWTRISNAEYIIITIA